MTIRRVACALAAAVLLSVGSPAVAAPTAPPAISFSPALQQPVQRVTVESTRIAEAEQQVATDVTETDPWGSVWSSLMDWFLNKLSVDFEWF